MSRPWLMALLRLVATVGCVGGLVVGLPGTASAHPLGNFTVNRYSGLVVSGDSVVVDHVLDIAEIPTAQRVPAIDKSGDGRLGPAEISTWARTVCADAAGALELTVDGTAAALSVREAAARSRAGQAGLPVLRVECLLGAEVSVSGRTPVTLVDTGAAGEVGWQEMTAVGDETTVASSDVPAESTSQRLTAYPKDLLTSPLTVTSAEVVVRPGGPALAGGPTAAGQPGVVAVPDRLTAAFEGLVARYDGGILVTVVALLGAVLLGAAHAVAPGHGKTIMAFFLSGRRDRALRSAATVGATVTVTHTAGVLLLGVLVSVGTAFAPARVYPWLSVASGLLVVAVGLTLLRAARRGGAVLGHSHGTGPGQHTHAAHPEPALVGAAHGPAPSIPTHPHDHGHPHEHGHPHDHGQAHDHGHAHDHGDPHDHAAEPSRGGLVAMGLAGGLVPSPSALLVFLAAVALGHPWFGTALVVAFGVGMAATLATVGVLVMRLRLSAESRLARRPRSRLAPVLRWAPVLTALAVTALGAILALRGLSGAGVV